MRNTHREITIIDPERWCLKYGERRKYYVQWHSSFWSDSEFLTLSNGAKVLFLWILNQSLRVNKATLSVCLDSSCVFLNCSLNDSKTFLNELNMSNFINMQSLTRKSTNGQLIEENKIEEKRIETKEKENYSQNYIALFNDDDIATWLMKTGNEKIQDALYKKYNHSFLTEETINAFNWNLENNKKRKAGTFLKGWMERSNNPDKISQANKEQAIIDKFPNLFGRD